MRAAAREIPELRIDAGDLQEVVDARLRAWQAEEVCERLWRRDHRLWCERPVPELTDRLGWLELPATMPARLAEIEALAAETAAAGLETVVLLGMGGSSLGAEMLATALGSRSRLRVADTTHPDAVARLADDLDPARVVFVASSKSGTTVETDSLLRFFWSWLERRVERPAERFVAITDAGSALAETATRRGFRRLFEAPAEVGGRYSVLGPFGLVPAALAGVELGPLLESAMAMAERSAVGVAAADHPGLRLAALLGEAAAAGRSVLQLAAAPAAAPFAPWLEQLIAESTGKDGRGILPVPAAPASAAGAAERGVRVTLGAVENGGEPPHARIELGAVHQLGAEIFRWQIGVAMASAVLGLHPFNQPDVQLAKELAQRAAAGEAGAQSPAVRSAAAADLAGWLDATPPEGYLAVQAFLAPTPATDELLERVRRSIGRRARVAATVGYGPRFLHSTGQLHKGGPANGRFLQLLDRPRAILEIPGSGLDFGRLLRAQADGDAAALEQRGRDLLRVDLGDSAAQGLAELAARVETT